MSQIKTNFPSVLGISADFSSQQLLLITNQKRQEAGLPPLTLDNELSQAATSKATDMFGKDYWAHISPSGETPWVFIQEAGYKYVFAGENLARGYNSAQDVINAWMASPEHKENMLSPNYKNVGFAVADGKLSGEDTVLVVEMLGSTNIASAQDQNSEKTVEVSDKGSLAKAELNPNNPPADQKTLAAKKLKAGPNSKDSVIAKSKDQKVLINSQTFTFSAAKMFVALFIFILLLDMILIERKKIIRFVGHNLDHIFFLSLILLAIIILARGATI